MPKVHLLNVSPGDCTIIQHASSHVTMMDICGGNQRIDEALRKVAIFKEEASKPCGNFRMCQSCADPISYLRSIGVTSLFRFILSHPDMDHMDGFDRLFDTFAVGNFWDSGSPRPKPDFGAGPYLEADWDRFEMVRKGREPGTTAKVRQAGDRFSFANQDDAGGGGDALYICAPTQGMLDDPDFEDDVNEGSYVISYYSAGGRVVLPGDAHDNAWAHVIGNHREDVEDCAFLLAPHHGRDSGRSYDFLDVTRPKLTLIGCSPSKHIDYGQWTRRGLDYITANQAGNVVLDTDGGGIDVYMENERYVEACGLPTWRKDEWGNTFFRRLPK